MRIIHNLKAYRFFFATVWLAGLSLISPTFANSYIVDLNSKKVIDLGSDVVANAINDAGQVVGQRSGHAFITGPGGMGIRDIGTLGGAQSWASGINAAGQVVGWSNTSEGARHAFITGPDGVGMKDLGTGPDSVDSVSNIGTVVAKRSSSALAINNAGQVVGWFDGYIQRDSPPAIYMMHAFITGPNGADMRDLGKDIAPFNYTKGSGINAAGQVTGDKDSDPFIAVFIIGQNGTDITLVGGLGGLQDFASGINDTGQVIGASRTAFSAGDVLHAFVTGPAGVGIRDLGTLGGPESQALGINDAGQVVGYSGIAPGDYADRHAFVADPNSMGMADLNSVVSPPAGVTFTGASAINNVGQIVASGMTTVIPEPESYALMLSGLILIGLMARRKYLMM